MEYNAVIQQGPLCIRMSVGGHVRFSQRGEASNCRIGSAVDFEGCEEWHLKTVRPHLLKDYYQFPGAHELPSKRSLPLISTM